MFSHLPLSSRRKHAPPRARLLRDAPKRQRAHHQPTRVHRVQAGSGRRGQTAAGEGHTHPTPRGVAGAALHPRGEGDKVRGAGTQGAREGWPPTLCLQGWPCEQLRSNTQVSDSSISVGSFSVPQHRNHTQDQTTSSQLPVPRVFHCSRHQRHKQGRAAGTPWGQTRDGLPPPGPS